MALSLGARRTNTIVGLDIEAASVAATEVIVNGDARLGRSGIAPLGSGVSRDGEVGDAEALAASVKELFQEQKLPRDVRLGIANQRLIVRTIRLPQIEDPSELDAAVRFKAQEELAIPLEQSVFDWQRITTAPEVREEGKVDVVAVAARREMVRSLVHVVREAGLRPVGIDVSAFGLIRALRDIDPTDGQVPADGAGQAPQPARLLCCLGDNTNLVVAREGDCLFTRVSAFGIEGIAQRLSERRGLTLEHSRQWMRHVGLDDPIEEVEGDPAIVADVREVLDDGVTKLADEIRLSLDYYGTQEGAQAIEEIVACGPAAVIPGIAAALERLLGYPIRVASPSALAGLEAGEAARLTVPYGLALER